MAATLVVCMACKGRLSVGSETLRNIGPVLDPDVVGLVPALGDRVGVQGRTGWGSEALRASVFGIKSLAAVWPLRERFHVW